MRYWYIKPAIQKDKFSLFIGLTAKLRYELVPVYSKLILWFRPALNNLLGIYVPSPPFWISWFLQYFTLTQKYSKPTKNVKIKYVGERSVWQKRCKHKIQFCKNKASRKSEQIFLAYEVSTTAMTGKKKKDPFWLLCLSYAGFWCLCLSYKSERGLTDSFIYNYVLHH